MSIAVNAGFANTLNDTLNRHPVVVSESNGFGLALERMRGMAQGSINTGASNALHDALSSQAAVANEMALPFRDTLSALSALGAEKTSKVSTNIADKSAEFDPFSVVRSGALPENNAFVLALKRLYGLVVDPSPVPQITDAITLGATPVQIENIQAKQASMDLPPTTDHSPEPITGLSQLISNAVEQSAATTVNQEVMDTVLNKLS
jgi:hypothetical protein